MTGARGQGQAVGPAKANEPAAADPVVKFSEALPASGASAQLSAATGGASSGAGEDGARASGARAQGAQHVAGGAAAAEAGLDDAAAAEDHEHDPLELWYAFAQVTLGLTSLTYMVLVPVRFAMLYTVDATYVFDYALDVIATAALVPTLWEMWLLALENHDERYRKALMLEAIAKGEDGVSAARRQIQLQASARPPRSSWQMSRPRHGHAHTSQVMEHAAKSMRRTMSAGTLAKARGARVHAFAPSLAADDVAEEATDRAPQRMPRGAPMRQSVQAAKHTAAEQGTKAKELLSNSAMRFGQLALVLIRLVQRPQSISLADYLSDFTSVGFNFFLMLSCLPWDLVWLGVLGFENAYPTIPFVRLTRLLVALRLHSYLRMLALNQRMGYTTTKIIKIMTWTFLCAHMMAVLFFLAARLGYCGEQGDMLDDPLLAVLYRQHGGLAPVCGHYERAVWVDVQPGVRWTAFSIEELPVTTLYLRSLYWAFMTLTTVGHVDKIDHGTPFEFCFAIGLMLVSTVVYAYTLAEMTSLLIGQDAKIERYRRKLASVEKYLSKRRIDVDTRVLVRQHFKSAYENEDDNDDEIIGHMPRALRQRVLLSANAKLLSSAAFTIGVDTTVTDALAAAMGRVVFMADESIIEQGVVPLEMFILEEGRVSKDRDPMKRSRSSGAGSASGYDSEYARSEAGDSDADALSSAPDEAEADYRLDELDEDEVRSCGGGSKEESGEMDSPPRASQHGWRHVVGRAMGGAAGLSRGRDISSSSLGTAGTEDEGSSVRRGTTLGRGLPSSGGADGLAAAAGWSQSSRQASVVGVSRQRSTASRDSSKSARGGAGAGAKAGRRGAKARRAKRRAKGSIVLEEPGSTLCDAAFVFGVRNPYTAVAHVRSTLLTIRRGDFGAVMAEFKADAATIRENLLRAVQHENDRSFQAKLQEMQRMKQETTVTEMCYAAGQGDVKRVLILASDIAPDMGDYDGRTALHVGASEGHLHVCKALLELGARVNVKDRWGGTPLRDALDKGHIELARYLHARHAKLLMSETDMAGKLCEAAKAGELELIRMYLSCGAEPNAADYDKRTPLHVACSEGNSAIIRVLVDYGADKSPVDRFGNTPLHDTLRHGHRDLAAELADSGFELLLGEAQLAGELCEAAKAGELEQLRVFERCGATLDSSDYDRRTCLHVAASEGNTAIVAFLIQHRARVNPIDRFGNTPLHDCIRHEHHATAALLRRHGGLIAFTDPSMAATGDGLLFDQAYLYPGEMGLGPFARELTSLCKWSDEDAAVVVERIAAWDSMMTTVADLRGMSKQAWAELSRFLLADSQVGTARWGPRREGICRERAYATTHVVDEGVTPDALRANRASGDSLSGAAFVMGSTLTAEETGRAGAPAATAAAGDAARAASGARAEPLESD